MKLTLKTLKAVNNVFGRLCKLGRWTDFVSENKYNELAKQSLNCIVTYRNCRSKGEMGNVSQNSNIQVFPKGICVF